MEKLLSAKELSVSYGKKSVFCNLSIEVKTGELIGICGPNGAGKSTVLKLLAYGKIPELFFDNWKQLPSLDNQLIQDMSCKKRARKIAYMSQNEDSIWDYSVHDYILTGRYSHSVNGFYSSEDLTKVKEILNFLHIENLSEKHIHNISGGEFQKVRIARALCQEPDFLLLDEPGSNLDFVYEPMLLSDLKKIAKEKGIGILISIHDINLAVKYADKILLISFDSGSLFGNSRDIVTVENLKKIYGVDFVCKKIESFQSLQ